MAKPDPFRAYRFRLEINQITRGAFQSVGGLARESKIEPFREGGVNHFEHQLVTQTTYPALMLKRGLTDFDLWDWHQNVIDGKIERETIAIVLLDEKGQDAFRWVCEEAYPSKWTGVDLDATANSIATESVEFVHHGLTRT